MTDSTPTIASHELVDAASLTPAERERRKSPVRKAEDVIYVITHTVTCLTCDMLKPLIGPHFAYAWDKGRHAVIGGKKPEPAELMTFKGWLKHVSGWFEAELVGDALSVIPVVATQRYMPGVVDKFDRGMEKVFGGVYRWGAERETRKWAAEHGILEGSSEFRAHADKIYRDEAAHFGQMFEWTVLSTGTNILYQKYIVNPREPLLNQRSLKDILTDKVGAGLTASALVMGSRAAFPNASQKRDRWMGQNVILPITTVLAKPFGIDADAVREASSEKFGIAPRNAVAPGAGVADDRRPDAPPTRIAANENVRGVGETPTSRVERAAEPQRMRAESAGLAAR